MPTKRELLETTIHDMKAFADECDAKGALTPDDRTKLDRYSTTVTTLAADIRAENAKMAPGSFDGFSETQLAGMSNSSSYADNSLGFGAKAASAVQAAGGSFGVKALLSGTIDVPNMIEQSIVQNPQAPTTFLDLIRDRRQIQGTNTFSYLKQTARTHNAAPVADAALKPTSVYTVAEIEDRVRVVAHLSEAIPERYFADHRELQRFLESEMRAGLLAALESQVANGSGTGENMTGILNTSGTTAVAFATNTLTTARKAVTALRNLGEQPTAWVLNPADDEAFDLLREDGATGGFLLDQGEALWRIPRVTSAKVPAGQAILADWRQARLVIREDNQLAADRSGDNFTHNLVQLRLEGRYGFAVLRPQAFAVVDLTA
jgi:HK97 family phage major capsid protein